MTFSEPLYFFLLLLLIPFVVWHFVLKRRYAPTLTMPATARFAELPKTFRQRLLQVPVLLRMLAFTALVCVLARPQTHEALHESETEGIDIMLAMDISESMLTNDLRPNRISVAKEVAYDFISERPNDNIGLTLFSGEAFTQCPLTMNHATLLSMFRTVNCDLSANGIIEPGTAIGMGVASAVSHLEKSKAKSKVVILLTDGENNCGEIAPLMAAEIAKKCGIRVYTILLGKGTRANLPVAQLPNGEVYEQEFDLSVNPETLKDIAKITGGTFYVAESRKSLRNIYSDIDKLEKTKLKVINYDKRYEAYQPFALVAVIALLLEVLLRCTWLRRNP